MFFPSNLARNHDSGDFCVGSTSAGAGMGTGLGSGRHPVCTPGPNSGSDPNITPFSDPICALCKPAEESGAVRVNPLPECADLGPYQEFLGGAGWIGKACRVHRLTGWWDWKGRNEVLRRQRSGRS